MKKRDPSTGESPPAHLVAQAERQLAAYGAELDAVIQTIQSGDVTASRELATVVASLRKALEAVFSERAKLEKITRESGQRDGELDLAAARAEVRRRMDRLRAAHAAAKARRGCAPIPPRPASCPRRARPGSPRTASRPRAAVDAEAPRSRRARAARRPLPHSDCRGTPAASRAARMRSILHPMSPRIASMSSAVLSGAAA